MVRRKYFSRAKMWWDYGFDIVDDAPSGNEFIPRSVTEEAEGPVFSGILDKDGNQIMRWIGPEPIGFVIFEGEEEE